MNREIIYKGEKYLVCYDKDGNKFYKHYDEEFKIWVSIYFSKEDSKHIDEAIIDILSKEYIQKATSKE